MDRLTKCRFSARFSTVTTTWILGTLVALLAPPAWADGPATPLFASADGIAAPPLARGPEVVRWRAVRLDGTAEESLRRGDDLALELFDTAGETEILAVHSRSIANASGSVSWIGSVRGRAADPVVLVSRDGITIGSIRVGGRLVMLYFAGYDDDGAPVHALVEVDEGSPRFRHAEEEPAVWLDPRRVEQAAARAERMRRGEEPQDHPSVQDLMVVYTPKAVEVSAMSGIAVENLIDLGVTETNMSYEASGIAHRLRLVHVAFTDFNEDEATGIDPRDHLQDPDDGYMDEIHPARELYRADMVKLLTGRSCGRAFKMDVISLAHAEFAFCRTSVGCVSPGYTFAHELGHVAAGRHQRPTDVAGSPLPYNFGYVDIENQFRTIMAAGESDCPDGCPRRLAWSNPDVLDAETGAPMGLPEGDPESADNRKTLNFTAWYVANFRVSGDLVFADGFESGDLTAWSEEAPP